MKFLSPSLRILLGTVALITIGACCLYPFLFMYLTDFMGLTITQATLCMSWYALFPVIGGPWAGFLQNRFPGKILCLTSCLLDVLGLIILFSQKGGMVSSFAAVSLMALSHSFLGVTLKTTLSQALESDQISSGASLMHAAGNVGWFVGPAIGGLFLVRQDYKSALLVAMGIFLLCFIVLAIFYPSQNHRKEDVKAGEIKGIWSGSLIAYLFLYFCTWAMIPHSHMGLAKYAIEYCKNPGLVALFNPAQAVLVILFVPLAGRLAGGWDSAKFFRAFMIGNIIYAFGLAGTALGGNQNPAWGLSVLGTTMTIWEMLMIPAAGALAALIVPKEKLGAVFGLQTCVGALGQALGSSMSGFILARSSEHWPLFWIHGGLLFLGLNFACILVALYAIRSKTVSTSPAFNPLPA